MSARKTFEQKQQELIDREVSKALVKLAALRMAYDEKRELYIVTLPEPVRAVIDQESGRALKREGGDKP